MDFTYDFAEVNGKVPMIEFLNSLTVKERAKIFAHDRVKKFKQIILTHGFIKKEQKTSRKEIERAKSIRKIWRSKR